MHFDVLRRQLKEETDYQWRQDTKPQTMDYGRPNSIAELAAWVPEKFRAGSDCSGEIGWRFSKGELFNHITVYWMTGAINASCGPMTRVLMSDGRSPWPIP